ncbi:Hypothetical predicted protein [Paramuricea clavata]|uniref:Uncharacterized protein n=1 Tax=Paramuricea clavata TaxID=317549 RepID=A0A6S7H4V3_PARCT|nr:Hypothetical predicted protein [Paramuricea clavata]
MPEFGDSISKAQKDYRVNIRDSHRSDKIKKASHNHPIADQRHVAKKAQQRYFEKSVENVSMDIIEYKSEMTSFEFKILDTMGYLQSITIRKDEITCSSPGCTKKCHHLVWIFHKIFKMEKSCPLIYQRNFTNADWGKITDAFPERVPTTDISNYMPKNQVFKVGVKKTEKTAKCASCKTSLSLGDIQASTEGPYRTLHLNWIKRVFYFCPRTECISKLPRNTFIKTFEDGVPVLYDTDLTYEQKCLL